MNILKKGLSYLTKLEYAIMVVAFTTMVISYFISVVNRNIIKASMPWTEEVAIYCMVYMALLGTEVGLRDGTQVAVTAVVEKLGGKLRKFVDLIKQIILVVFSFLMTGAGMSLVSRQMQTGQTSPVLKIPMSMMYFSMVLAFGLIFLIQGITLIEMLIRFPKKEVES